MLNRLNVFPSQQIFPLASYWSHSKNIAQYNFTSRFWDEIFDLHSCQNLCEQQVSTKDCTVMDRGRVIIWAKECNFDSMKVRSETQFGLTTSPLNTFLYLWGRIYPLWIPLVTPMGSHQWSNAPEFKKQFCKVFLELFGTTSTEPSENNFKNAISCLCWGKNLGTRFQNCSWKYLLSRRVPAVYDTWSPSDVTHPPAGRLLPAGCTKFCPPSC